MCPLASLRLGKDGNELAEKIINLDTEQNFKTYSKKFFLCSFEF